MAYLEQFKKHVAANLLSSVVQLWEEYCYSEEVDPKEFLDILTTIRDSSIAKPFGCYASSGLLLWESLPSGRDKDEVLSLIYDLQTTNEKELHGIALAHLEKKHGNDPHFKKKLKLVGLHNGDNCQYAISNFEVLMHAQVGNFFLHKKGWGIGIVTDISLLRQEISINFDSIGEKDITIDSAFKILIPASKDHFLSRRFQDPSFPDYALEKPIEVVLSLLRDMGPKSAFEIKEEICGYLVEESKWPQWWQVVRNKMKKHLHIHVPKKSTGAFIFLGKEISHEERFFEKISKVTLQKEISKATLDFLRHFPKIAKQPSFCEKLERVITPLINDASLGIKIELLFILNSIGEAEISKIVELISHKSSKEIVRGFREISTTSLKKHLLKIIAEHLDHYQIFLDLLFDVEVHHSLIDFIVELLLQEHIKSFEDILLSSLEEPSLETKSFIIWYFGEALSGNAYLGGKLSSDINYPYKAWESVLSLLYIMERLPQKKSSVKKIISMITNNHFTHLRNFFVMQSKEASREILLLISKCQSFSSDNTNIAHSLAQAHHQIGHEKEEEEVIWSTQEALKRVRERMHHISSIEMVKNAKEVESARSHGDLRENSEYKYAIEKRNHLQSELRQLSKRLNSTRVIRPEDISTNEIGIGCVVTLSDGDHKVTYTLLDFFDSDPEKKILSIHSKIGKSLIGKQCDDECEIPEGRWKVISIDSIF